MQHSVCRRDVALAVPPPRIHVPETNSLEERSGPSGPSCPRGSHSFRGIFSRCLGSPKLEFWWVPGESRRPRTSTTKGPNFEEIRRSQPLRPTSKACAYRTAYPELRIPSYQPCHSRAPTLGTFPAFEKRHFLRSDTLDPRGSGLGCGPCLAKGGKTHCHGLESKAPLCSFSTTYLSSGLTFHPWFSRSAAGVAQLP